MTDARPTWARKDALLSMQARFPSLFPVKHVQALESYTVKPGPAMEEGGIQAYVDYLEVTVAHHILRDSWPKEGDAEITAFLTDAITLGEKLTYSDGSVNEMRVHTLALKDGSMMTLADECTEAVLKSQELRVTDREAPKTMNNALFEFTTDVIIARLLNLLLTVYPHTVTPHFTTFFGCFRRSAKLVDATSRPGTERVYSAFERGHVSLHVQLEREYASASGVCPTRLKARLFAIISALAAASHVLGISHNDLALRNIMERNVTDTAYAGAHWAYKLRNVPRYFVVPPTAHAGHMIKIIDYGRATITESEPDSANSANALRFAYDVRELLNDLLELHVMRVTDQKRADPLNVLMAQITTRIATWPQRPHSESDPNLREDAKAAAQEIYQKWHTDDAAFGLGFLFADFRIAAPAGVTPIVVSIAPNENILRATKDPFALELARIWGVEAPAAGKRIAYSVQSCRTCASPSTHATENGKHGFCGTDCYRVFYGKLKRKRSDS